jgi:hypothetical protein
MRTKKSQGQQQRTGVFRSGAEEVISDYFFFTLLGELDGQIQPPPQIQFSTKKK